MKNKREKWNSKNGSPKSVLFQTFKKSATSHSIPNWEEFSS